MNKTNILFYLNLEVFINKFNNKTIKFYVNRIFKYDDNYTMILERKGVIYFFYLNKPLINLLKFYIYDIENISKCFIYIKPKDMDLTIVKIIYEFKEVE